MKYRIVQNAIQQVITIIPQQIVMLATRKIMLLLIIPTIQASFSRQIAPSATQQIPDGRPRNIYNMTRNIFRSIVGHIVVNGINASNAIQIHQTMPNLHARPATKAVQQGANTGELVGIPIIALLAWRAIQQGARTIALIIISPIFL